MLQLAAAVLVSFVWMAGPLSARTLPLERMAPKEAKKIMEIKSSVFENNQVIAKKYTGEGEDVSPPLTFSSVPDKTKSLALIMDDPDAPPGTWIHWLIYDLPADTRNLRGDMPRKEFFRDGAKQGLCWGVDSFDRVGYYGPLPPPGKPHHYFFKLYALDKTSGLPPRANKEELLKAMKGHVLASAELVGIYEHGGGKP